MRVWKQDKNQINPLGRMEGDALLLCFRLGLIKASSYRPNRKHTTTFLQKVTILPKAINRNKPLSCGVVPFRHQSACRVLVMWLIIV